MPRKRDLSPDIWRSDQFLDLPSDTHRLTFVAAISLADDLGIGRVADLRRHTGLAAIDLAPLERGRLLVTYGEQEGTETIRYFLLPTWCRHQFVKKPSPPKLPLPSDWKALIPERFQPKYRPCRVLSTPSGPPVDHHSTTGGPPVDHQVSTGGPLVGEQWGGIPPALTPINERPTTTEERHAHPSFPGGSGGTRAATDRPPSPLSGEPSPSAPDETAERGDATASGSERTADPHDEAARFERIAFGARGAAPAGGAPRADGHEAGGNGSPARADTRPGPEPRPGPRERAAGDPGAPAKKRRKGPEDWSPDERLARELQGALGTEYIRPCRGEIKALLKAGLPHDAIRAAIAKHANVSVRVFDFRHVVLGANGPARRTDPPRGPGPPPLFSGAPAEVAFPRPTKEQIHEEMAIVIARTRKAAPPPPAGSAKP